MDPSWDNLNKLLAYSHVHCEVLLGHLNSYHILSPSTFNNQPCFSTLFFLFAADFGFDLLYIEPVLPASMSCGWIRVPFCVNSVLFNIPSHAFLKQQPISFATCNFRLCSPSTNIVKCVSSLVFLKLQLIPLTICGFSLL